MNRILDFKELVPKSVKNALNQIGERKIVSARCGRTPVQAIIQGALKTVANVPYDDLFHLFIELTLDNGQKWILEKIERINLVKEDRSKKQGAEFTSSFPVNKTVNELFQNTRNKMGDKFLPYQSASNNCQYFIMGVLDGNGLNNSERAAFVKQDTNSFAWVGISLFLPSKCSIIYILNYELWVHAIDGFRAMTLPSVLYNGKRYNVMSVAHDALQELPPARGSLRRKIKHARPIPRRRAHLLFQCTSTQPPSFMLNSLAPSEIPWDKLDLFQLTLSKSNPNFILA